MKFHEGFMESPWRFHGVFMKFHEGFMEFP